MVNWAREEKHIFSNFQNCSVYLFAYFSLRKTLDNQILSKCKKTTQKERTSSEYCKFLLWTIQKPVFFLQHLIIYHKIKISGFFLFIINKTEKIHLNEKLISELYGTTEHTTVMKRSIQSMRTWLDNARIRTGRFTSLAGCF